MILKRAISELDLLDKTDIKKVFKKMQEIRKLYDKLDKKYFDKN